MTSTYASVVISPATMHWPVVTSVSHATREFLSWASSASRIASLIWSATLSGWPMVTDSLVKRCPLRRYFDTTLSCFFEEFDAFSAQVAGNARGVNVPHFARGDKQLLGGLFWLLLGGRRRGLI